MNFEQIYVGGKWINPSSSTLMDVINPSTEEVYLTIPRSSPEDVDAAIQAAFDAKELWKNTPLDERITLLSKALQYMEENQQDLALAISREMGSPISSALKVQVQGPLRNFGNYLALAEETPFVEEHQGYLLYRDPVGVVSCMTPWNYPLNQVIQKVIPALVTGNTVVLKPSSESPSPAFYLAEAFHQANLPAGVFNMITGKGSDVGEQLSSDPRIDMVSFTGSTKVGKEIQHHAAETIKKVALELGGKSPAILLDGGDVDLAVKRVMNSCFYNSGQTCSAFTRFFVPAHLEQEVIDKIKESISHYQTGDPEKEDTKLGPLVSKGRYDSVKEYIESGIEEGAELVLGEIPQAEKGFFVEPCVFTKVTSDMKIAKEEIFGPVLSLFTYDDLDEVIEEANATPYGLSGAVFGEKKEAIALAEKIETGNVHINENTSVFQAPFGGYKQSGIGRESGRHGLLEFTEIKAVFTG